jgi:photosystem II stability/assembly factor-like uncharacterized protein
MSKLRIIGLAGILTLPGLMFGAAKDLCYLKDASSPTPSTAFVMCEQGEIYGTHDTGATWKTYKTGAQETLHSIAFTDANRGYVVGDAGTILLTGDGANTWSPRDSGTKENLLAVFALGSEVWAGGFDGAILQSADSGQTWQAQNSNTTLGIEDIYFADSQHGWAVGWSGMILRTLDGGRNWQPVESPGSWSLSSVFFRDLQNGWAVGFEGELLRSKDGGATWESQKSPIDSVLSSVAVDRANRIWVAADEQLVVSEDGGNTWRAIPVSATLFLNKMLPVGDGLWAVGELGALAQTGSGAEWKRIDSLVTANSYIAESLDASVFKSAEELEGR